MAKLSKTDRETYKRLGHPKDRARFLKSINAQAQALTLDRDEGLERGILVESRVNSWAYSQNQGRRGSPKLKVNVSPYGKGKPSGVRIVVSFEAPRGKPETILVNVAWSAAKVLKSKVKALASGIVGHAKVRMIEEDRKRDAG